jgi:hypothetical protein
VGYNILLENFKLFNHFIITPNNIRAEFIENSIFFNNYNVSFVEKEKTDAKVGSKRSLQEEEDNTLKSINKFGDRMKKMKATYRSLQADKGEDLNSDCLPNSTENSKEAKDNFSKETQFLKINEAEFRNPLEPMKPIESNDQRMCNRLTDFSAFDHSAFVLRAPDHNLQNEIISRRPKRKTKNTSIHDENINFKKRSIAEPNEFEEENNIKPKKTKTKTTSIHDSNVKFKKRSIAEPNEFEEKNNIKPKKQKKGKKTKLIVET